MPVRELSTGVVGVGKTRGGKVARAAVKPMRVEAEAGGNGVFHADDQAVGNC